MDVDREIAELERGLGFPVRRVETTDETRRSHDETFSYDLCQRFLGKEEELERAMRRLTRILLALSEKTVPDEEERKRRGFCYSLLGNMHYMRREFLKSIGCFMKALDDNRRDMTGWIELMFAVRAHGDFETFERIIFNLDCVYETWRNSGEEALTRARIEGMIRACEDG